MPYNAELESQGGLAPIYFAAKNYAPPEWPDSGKWQNIRHSNNLGIVIFSVLAEDSNPSLRSSTEQSFTLEIASYGLEISSEPTMISAKVQGPVAGAYVATGGEPPIKWATGWASTRPQPRRSLRSSQRNTNPA